MLNYLKITIMANKEKRSTVNVKKEKGTNKKANRKTEYQRTRDAYNSGTKSYRRACRENTMIAPRRVE